MLMSRLLKKLTDNTISDDDLLICLQSENFRLVAMSISRLIERNLDDISIIDRLLELSHLLTNNKFVGVWQFGHFAIATLSLLQSDVANAKFSEIYNELHENDKFLVDNFIKAEAYKL